MENLIKENLIQNDELIGRKIGTWTIVSGPKNRNDKRRRKGMLRCDCECGTIRWMKIEDLKNNNILRCPSDHPKYGHIKVGNQFNYLTVIQEPKMIGKYSKVLCRCVCGKEKQIPIRNLQQNKGGVKSCGCKFRELKNVNSMTKGYRGERLCTIWDSMRQRCYNPNTHAFKNYGGKGIKVCDEWKENYVAFRMWALSHGYNDNLTIHRIDSDKNYYPENCTWVTKAENSSHVTGDLVRKNKELMLQNKVFQQSDTLLKNQVCLLETILDLTRKLTNEGKY